MYYTLVLKCKTWLGAAFNDKHASLRNSTTVKSFIVQAPEKDFAASTKKQINRNETWADTLNLLQLELLAASRVTR